ncbi:type II toxin-antitoxin system RelE/ParE family toxin [Sphingomonas sp. RP10(2022)]|uniref:Type II toxin-antitoxin system RelE/ParE family toxin n=1 Tax=Sphingomonas liriopis TaxID=2949094 RepID=A0A9X2KQB5_9SPHN|nr:type II toxin-antitoxin system RelE/ParE family toxin [Sphingomonas liriopis]MCP3734815.1 type II toxin-antitoxin system RelE/ParE family toxin [Sphingomonas liriopis]
MNVSFTPQARDDLIAIRDWIARDDERAADRVVSRIVQTAMMFGSFPMLGRTGQVTGTREFSVVGLPYLIVYALASETEIDVLTVLHTRRRYPPVA